MSMFWSFWIGALTITNLVLLLWILFANRKRKVVSTKDGEEVKTTGHVYDGIEEYDNPLPRWWFYMFVLTFIFAAAYLVIFPGLGHFKGVRGWTSVGELRADQAKAELKYADLYGNYAKTPIAELAKDPAAMKIGFNLFANNCALCHGSDGGGNIGFPNLTDNDWLYGGEPEKILETITEGRHAAMPAWGDILGEKGVFEVTDYVLSLAGREHTEANVTAGKSHYEANCVACHGDDAKGNTLFGAPNLTDDIWLYGGDAATIRQSVRAGRSGIMPAQKELLKEDRIHLLAAYVYSLSQE
jgi:cytochrome c oxidase cbb3-type subunit 3